MTATEYEEKKAHKINCAVNNLKASMISLYRIGFDPTGECITDIEQIIKHITK